MLMFYLMIYKHEERYERYMNLSEDDKDKIMTFFNVVEVLIIWFICLTIIFSRW